MFTLEWTLRLQSAHCPNMRRPVLVLVDREKKCMDKELRHSLLSCANFLCMSETNEFRNE